MGKHIRNLFAYMNNVGTEMNCWSEQVNALFGHMLFVTNRTRYGSSRGMDMRFLTSGKSSSKWQRCGNAIVRRKDYIIDFDRVQTVFEWLTCLKAHAIMPQSLHKGAI